MSNPYPVEIADPGDGVVKTAGNLTFTDPANQPGGGSLPWLSAGSGSPVDTVTPSQKGAVYVDTTNGALYLAMGTADTDWVEVGTGAGGGNIGSTTGLIWDSGRNAYLLSGERDTINSTTYIGDAYAMWNGNSEGLTWQNAGTHSELRFKTHTQGADVLTGYIADPDGNIKPANTIDVSDIPTSNPGPGLLWNNAGVLAIGT